MWILNTVGVPLSFPTTTAFAGILVVAAMVAGIKAGTRVHGERPEIRYLLDLPTAHKLLFMCLLLLVGLRVTTLGLEVFWRPLFPWDATMHWATKARVWFEYRNMEPFVDHATWLATFGKGVYTDENAGYPATIPLLQVWMNLAAGRWDESVMNLPWVLCFVALGGAFYGQLRNAGVGPRSRHGVYLPPAVHAIDKYPRGTGGLRRPVPGRHLLRRVDGAAQLVIEQAAMAGPAAGYFALACLRLKLEGFLWSLTLIPALIVATARSTRRAIALLGGLAVAGLVLLLLLRQMLPDSLHPFLQQFTPFSMKGLLGIVKSGWLHANWHLFTYLLPVSIALALLLPPAVIRGYRAIATALTVAAAAFLFLFLFTVFWMGSANFTGVGRLSIQLAPGLMFLCALLCNEVLNRGIAWPARKPAAAP